MANYNIEMQYYNGTSYDVLYPNIPLNSIINWEDTIYSKIEFELLGNNYIMNGNTSNGSVYTNIFLNDSFVNYDGLFFNISYSNSYHGGTSGNAISNYLLSVSGISLCPVFNTNSRTNNVKIFLPVIGRNFTEATAGRSSYFYFFSLYNITHDSGNGTVVYSPSVKTINWNNNLQFSIADGSGMVRFDFNVTINSIYKYKLNT